MSNSAVFLDARPVPAYGPPPTSLYTNTAHERSRAYMGAAAPVNGWGFAGMPYGGFAPNPGVFGADCGPVEGELGFSFEKLENGPPDCFNFAMVIMEVANGSWAQRSGITAGCVILSFNGKDTQTMTMEELRESLAWTRPFSLLLQRPDGEPAQEYRAQKLEGDEPQAYSPDFYEDQITEAVNVTAKQIYDQYDGYSLSKAIFEMPPGVLKMFPTAFLLFSLAMFAMPVFLLYFVGLDINARQWFPHITNLVVILPAFYMLTFIAHVIKQAPSRFFITVSLVGSCILLLVVSDMILMDAYQIGPMFAADTDCMSWDWKRQMQDQWGLARSFYADCANGVAKKDGIPFEAAVNNLRIQDCPNYANTSAFHPDWAYLENLEETEQCGGWCTPAPPLWTRRHVQDACSPVVAEIIRDKIVWCLKQVLFYSVGALVVTSMILIGIPPVMRKYGIEW